MQASRIKGEEGFEETKEKIELVQEHNLNSVQQEIKSMHNYIYYDKRLYRNATRCGFT